jgi:hypothetical protein
MIAMILLAAAMTATSAPSALQPAFHNTIVSTYPDGRKAELWLSADGTYVAEGRKHDRSNGVWTMKGSDQICLRQKTPSTIPLPYCTGVPTGGVGSAWSAKSVFGDALRVKLVAGRSRG